MKYTWMVKVVIIYGNQIKNILHCRHTYSFHIRHKCRCLVIDVVLKQSLWNEETQKRCFTSHWRCNGKCNMLKIIHNVYSEFYIYNHNTCNHIQWSYTNILYKNKKRAFNLWAVTRSDVLKSPSWKCDIHSAFQ